MLLRDFSEEQKLCGDIKDRQTRACAVANLVGIRTALEFFESCGLSADTHNAVHKIKSFLEELNIADVYVGDLRFDVRVSTVDGEFPVPKKHFEFDVTPDLYMLVFYDRTTGESRVSGFISPVDVDKSDSDENYYYVSKNIITSASNTADLFDTLVAKAKNTIPLNLKKKILLYADGLLTDKKEFFNEVVNCAGAREAVLDFIQNQEILRKTNFAFAVADAELEALVVEDVAEEEVESDNALSDDEIDLGFADGLEVEDSSIILEEDSSVFEDDADEHQEPVAPEVVELDDFINNVPAEEPIVEESVEPETPKEDALPQEEIIEEVAEDITNVDKTFEEAVLDLEETVTREAAEDDAEVEVEEDLTVDMVDETIVELPVETEEESVEVLELVDGVEELPNEEVVEDEIVEEELDIEEMVEEVVVDEVEEDAIEEDTAEPLELDDSEEEVFEEVSEEVESLSLDAEEDVVDEVDEPAVEELDGQEDGEVLELEVVEEEIAEEELDIEEMVEGAVVDEVEEDTLEEGTAEPLELDDSEEEVFEEVSEEVEPLSLDVEEDVIDEVEEPAVEELEELDEGEVLELEAVEEEIAEEEFIESEEPELEPLDEPEIVEDMDQDLELDEESVDVLEDSPEEETLALDIEETEDLSLVETSVGDYEELESSVEDEEEVLEQVVDEEDFVVTNTVESEPSIDIKATMEGFVNSLEPEEGMSLKTFEEEIAPREEVVEDLIVEPQQVAAEELEQGSGEEVVEDDSVLEEVAIQDESVETPVEVQEVQPQEVMGAVDENNDVVQEEIGELYQGQVEEPEFEPVTSYRKAKKSGSGAFAAVLVFALAAAGAAGYFYKDMIMEKFFASSQQESIPNELATPTEASVAPPVKIQKKKAQTEAQEMLNDIEEPVQLLDSSVSVSALTVDCDVPSVMVNNHSRRYLIKLAKRMQLQLRNALLIAGEQPLANKIVIDLVVDKDVIKYDRISSSSGSKKVDSIVSATSETVLKDTQPYAGTFGKNSGVVKLIVKF